MKVIVVCFANCKNAHKKWHSTQKTQQTWGGAFNKVNSEIISNFALALNQKNNASFFSDFVPNSNKRKNTMQSKKWCDSFQTNGWEMRLRCAWMHQAFFIAIIVIINKKGLGCHQSHFTFLFPPNVRKNIYTFFLEDLIIGWTTFLSSSLPEMLIGKASFHPVKT